MRPAACGGTLLSMEPSAQSQVGRGDQCRGQVGRGDQCGGQVGRGDHGDLYRQRRPT